MATNWVDADECYKMDHKNRGHLVIINNYQFTSKNLKPLYGQKVDVENYRQTFVNLGFDQDYIRVCENLTAVRMLMTINSYAGIDIDTAIDKPIDYTDHDCFMAVFLSHGTSENNKQYIFGSDGNVVDLQNLIDPFIETKTLYGKPKIFFIDICRGPKIEPAHAESIDGFSKISCIDSNMPVQAYSNLPEHGKYSKKDFFFGFGSVFGFKTYTDKNIGSYYSISVCKAFKDHGDKKHLSDIVTRAHDYYSKDYQGYTGEIINTLRRSCYFSLTRNKLGDLVHSSILENQEQAMDLIKLCNFSLNDKFSLLYRASKDGFESSKFHAKCDNISRTLSIIKVDGHKNIFGGYTKALWNEDQAR